MMSEQCQFPRCKANADYGNMDCVSESGEEIGVMLCKIHATAIEIYNDAWKEDTNWPDFNQKERRRVSQIVYRLHQKGGKF